jgi:ssDNA-binding Zn-finger/Zn-ribbon topoisomerase 1
MPNGYVELECDEHGKFLISQRKADGEGGGWRDVKCPVCESERKSKEREKENESK